MIPSLSARIDVNMNDINKAINVMVNKHQNGLLEKNLKQIECEMNDARDSFIKNASDDITTPASICLSTIKKLKTLNNVKLKVFEPTDLEVMPLL
ncbi:hypothetical protein [Aliivibrio fischeri]|uniref:hypothetical protein n=1 Tax=Aliivibrio fischeri TaxID=668 RepID=UPI0012D8A85D|nr:hypothetical protein [Aliivibrio fischeri]MUJ20362.1 hypothetical protein [Aliivibrio fischeri]